jgi:uncharacterized protein GlcG (DUF336 family)
MFNGDPEGLFQYHQPFGKEAQMTAITLAQAQTIVSAALAYSREKNLNPMAVVVLDARGVPKAYAAEDGTALRRYDIAHGKAYGALAMGVGSKTLGLRAAERPHFIAAVNGAIGGALVPVAGGVLIRVDGQIAGCVGMTGDTSDNDELAARAGIAAAEGLTADPS